MTKPTKNYYYVLLDMGDGDKPVVLVPKELYPRALHDINGWKSAAMKTYHKDVYGELYGDDELEDSHDDYDEVEVITIFGSNSPVDFVY